MLIGLQNNVGVTTGKSTRFQHFLIDHNELPVGRSPHYNLYADPHQPVRADWAHRLRPLEVARAQDLEAPLHELREVALPEHAQVLAELADHRRRELVRRDLLAPGSPNYRKLAAIVSLTTRNKYLI